MNKYEKPPIGIKPRFIHDEQRFEELRQCIHRYLSAGLPINKDWIEEYNELSKKIKGENK